MTPQQRYQERCKIAGLCPCSRRLDSGYYRCSICRAQRKENNRKRKLQKLCLSCAKPVYLDKLACFDHCLKGYASNSLGSSDYAWHLAQLFLDQSGKCKYCQTVLEISVNAEIDHIQPISRFPKLQFDPNNVQWLCQKCNQAKWNMTESEFFEWATSLRISSRL